MRRQIRIRQLTKPCNDTQQHSSRLLCCPPTCYANPGNSAHAQMQQATEHDNRQQWSNGYIGQETGTVGRMEEIQGDGYRYQPGTQGNDDGSPHGIFGIAPADFPRGTQRDGDVLIRPEPGLLLHAVEKAQADSGIYAERKDESGIVKLARVCQQDEKRSKTPGIQQIHPALQHVARQQHSQHDIRSYGRNRTARHEHIHPHG